VRIDSIAFADLVRLGDPDDAVFRTARPAAEKMLARKTRLGFRDRVRFADFTRHGLVWHELPTTTIDPGSISGESLLRL
jgi:hypothetical protein